MICVLTGTQIEAAIYHELDCKQSDPFAPLSLQVPLLYKKAHSSHYCYDIT